MMAWAAHTGPTPASSRMAGASERRGRAAGCGWQSAGDRPRAALRWGRTCRAADAGCGRVARSQGRRGRRRRPGPDRCRSCGCPLLRSSCADPDCARLPSPAKPPRRSGLRSRRRGCRGVSTPTTAATMPAMLGTIRFFFRDTGRCRHRSGWSQRAHICEESPRTAERLPIRPAGGRGRCRRPRRTGQDQGTPAAKSVGSHTGSPAPTLAAQPGAPQRHSQIRS